MPASMAARLTTPSFCLSFFISLRYCCSVITRGLRKRPERYRPRRPTAIYGDHPMLSVESRLSSCRILNDVMRLSPVADMLLKWRTKEQGWGEKNDGVVSR